MMRCDVKNRGLVEIEIGFFYQNNSEYIGSRDYEDVITSAQDRKIYMVEHESPPSRRNRHLIDDN